MGKVYIKNGTPVGSGVALQDLHMGGHLHRLS